MNDGNGKTNDLEMIDENNDDNDIGNEPILKEDNGNDGKGHPGSALDSNQCAL